MNFQGASAGGCLKWERFCETVGHNQTKRWLPSVAGYGAPSRDASAISDRLARPAQPGTVTTQGIATANRAGSRPFMSEKVIVSFKKSKVYRNTLFTEKPCPLNLDVDLTR